MTKTASTRIRAALDKRADEPGAIVAYHRRPRHSGEILCHNHVTHPSWMRHGVNGFRWFVCRAGSDHWQECPCGWRPDLGVHYAIRGHVRWTRKMLKSLGSQAAFDNYCAERGGLVAGDKGEL